MVVEVLRVSLVWWEYDHLFNDGFGLVIMIILGYPLMFFAVNAIWNFCKKYVGVFIIQLAAVYLAVFILIDLPNIAIEMWYLNEDILYLPYVIYTGYLLEVLVPYVADKYVTHS